MFYANFRFKGEKRKIDIETNYRNIRKHADIHCAVTHLYLHYAYINSSSIISDLGIPIDQIFSIVIIYA